MSDAEILDRAGSHKTCLSFSGKMTREQVMARLLYAQEKVIASLPALTSDEFLFNGDEINGPIRGEP